MLFRKIIFCLLSLVLTSCSSEKSAVVENSQDRDYVCGGSYDEPVQKILRGVSMFELGYAVKNGDTTLLQELICLDSVKFTRTLFDDVKVSEICLEMGIQGTTYFSTRTNKYGGFEDAKVLKSVNNCFRTFEKQIVRKVGEMRIIDEDFYNSEIVFRHKYMIR